MFRIDRPSAGTWPAALVPGCWVWWWPHLGVEPQVPLRVSLLNFRTQVEEEKKKGLPLSHGLRTLSSMIPFHSSLHKPDTRFFSLYGKWIMGLLCWFVDMEAHVSVIHLPCPPFLTGLSRPPSGQSMLRAGVRHARAPTQRAQSRTTPEAVMSATTP